LYNDIQARRESASQENAARQNRVWNPNPAIRVRFDDGVAAEG
jgi:hypothetical protein